MHNLFDNQSYDAQDIEVLEGLEPVRKRPGMYVGGTDEKALYHLVSEVLDNAMDEAIAGFASRITVHLSADNNVAIGDNGRGIPVDNHPKFPGKSALEVILTTLHSGGKFSNKAYSTAGGLHGVGVSVVNALSSNLQVQVMRDGFLYQQSYSKGIAISSLEKSDSSPRKRGTIITFCPDEEIFSTLKYTPDKIFQMVRSKAYLFKGVKIDWSCDAELLGANDNTPKKSTIHFPNGLQDFLESIKAKDSMLSKEPFCGEVEFKNNAGKVEWVVNWLTDFSDIVRRSYCNAIYTPLGGTHENGLRAALFKGLKHYAELVDNKKFSQVIADDFMMETLSILSVFIKNPSFQGQTKEKLLNQEASKLVENAIRDRFDHWLSANTDIANTILDKVIDNAQERINRKKSRETKRKTPIKSLRLPGKLSDCNKSDSNDTELFLVEGDSAGGSAKQARNRENQAILPLKGKILNVASNSLEKIKNNQEISDLLLALGCQTGSNYKSEDLRYERVIIMTDADVDGAHIASLLMTFFYLQIPQLIKDGNLYLAQPPLYRITQNRETYYANTEQQRDEMIEQLSKGKGKIDIGRFKGLGEMTPSQLKETTMDPSKRRLLQIVIDQDCDDTIESLMGKKPELRYKFITENAQIMQENIEKILDL